MLRLLQIFYVYGLFTVVVCLGKSLPQPASHYQSLAEYVTECEQAGIVLPQSLNCMKGEELPVYRSTCDTNGQVLTKTKITPENFENLAGHGQCDWPALVQKGNPRVGCMPGARIQTIASPTGHSVCALVCRRTDNRSAEGRFQDMSMICHNPENGATCFFNSKVDRSHDGVHVPRPGSSQGSLNDAVWMNPNELNIATCVRCHDNDPFIVTPNLGTFGKSLRERTKTSPFGKYYVVGDKLPFVHSAWKNRLHLNESNRCTTCHRIGSGEHGGCGYLRDSAASLNHTLNANCENQKGWMPPSNEKVSFSEIQESLSRIRECCKEIDKNGKIVPHSKCKWDAIPGG